MLRKTRTISRTAAVVRALDQVWVAEAPITRGVRTGDFSPLGSAVDAGLTDDVHYRHRATVMPMTGDIEALARRQTPGPAGGRDAEPTEHLHAQQKKPEDVETTHPTTLDRTEETA
ncbi:MAG: hypothetical protein ABWY29_08355 [Blastococcus sp.]